MREYKARDAAFNLDDSEDEYDEEESNDLSSDDENFDMIEYDNELTRNIWLPQEPRLFALYIGNKYISYNEENWMGGPESESEEDGPEEDTVIEDPLTHAEMIDLKNITNYK